MAQEIPPQPAPAPEPQAHFVKIDPAGTYLFTNRYPYDPDPEIQKYLPKDLANSPSYLDLTALYNDPIFPLKEGDLLSFELVGLYKPGDNFVEAYSDLGAVFTDNTNFLSPGLQTSAIGTYSPPTYWNNISTDISQDFGIPNGQVVYAQVPYGAKRILFSTMDSFYSDNSDSNGDFGIYIKLKIIKKKYKIIKEVSLGTTLQPNDTEINVIPSKLSGCNAPDTEIKKVKIKLTCVKILTDGGEEPVKGCKIKNTLNWYNKGPHQHTSDVDGNSTEDNIEHLGKLVTDINGTSYDISGELLDIPLTGLQLVYGVSAFAGKYSVDFAEAKAPDNQDLNLNRVIITASIAKSLTPLKDLLAFKALALNNKESHPYEGYFGTPLLHDRLSIALAQYRTEVIVLNQFLEQIAPEAILKQIKIPVIVSEAASLSWGGLYDTHKDWKGPHCTHRNGKHIDISMSPFVTGVKNKLLREMYREKLEKAFREAKLGFGRKEAPKDKKNHWHVQY